MATFRRNGNGDWVVLGSVEEMKVGKVRVSRKDQSVRTVKISSIGNPFLVDGKLMVYGYIDDSKEPKAPSAPVPPPPPPADDSEGDSVPF